MTDLKTVDLKNIQPIISQEIFKIFEDEVTNIIDNISEQYNISKEELKNKFMPNILNISIKMGVKKRNKRVLPSEVRCMGRKIDGEQCTRSRRNGCDYCLSHSKRLPHGRIDDDNFVKKVKGKRGRKKKSLDSEYIATKVQNICGTDYLVDEYDNVFTYNLNKSEYLGNKIDLIKKLDTCC